MRTIYNTVLSIAVALLSLLPAAAWAQPARVQEIAQSTGHGDSIGYLIVVFCLALGVIVACRSAYRRTEVLLDDLEDE